MTNPNSVAVLREVIRWAESRCPCHEEKSDPCTLCGASVANLEPCKAVDRIIPHDLLAKMRAALSAQGEWPNLPPIPAHAQPQTVSGATLILHPAPPGSDAVTEEMVRKALRRSYSLGQTYWQQADSESYSQNRKADETQAKFDALVAETCAALQERAHA